MHQSPHCLKCSSGNVVFSKKRKVNVCEDCGHQFGVPPSGGSLPWSDLAKRGHDVLFDKSEIKFSDNRRHASSESRLQAAPAPDRVNAELQTTPSPLGGERAGVRGDSHSRLFWLMGAPGVGKSAVAAHLAIHGHEVIAVEFCNWQQPGHKNPEQIVRTLAFQIATRLPPLAGEIGLN